jgi:hypothetical protein
VLRGLTHEGSLVGAGSSVLLRRWGVGRAQEDEDFVDPWLPSSPAFLLDVAYLLFSN